MPTEHVAYLQAVNRRIQLLERLQQTSPDNHDAVRAMASVPPAPPLPENLFSTGVSTQQVAVPSDKVSQVTAMGFPEDNARSALANNGLDVQRAINWLLQNAG